MKKSARDVGWFVVAIALLWACLPKPPHETTWESLRAHAYLTGHLLGWLPPGKPRTRFTSTGMTRGQPGARPVNGTIPEVQGFVDLTTFKQKYLQQGPIVFRKGATKEHGFDLECLTGTGKPLQEEMARHMGKRKARVFKDSYDDGSATFMTIDQYAEIAARAKANLSMAVPYPRAVPQSALGECTPVPEKKLEQYHGMFSSAAMLADGAKALIFYSLNKGTTTKMHMDVGSSFFTQVYGRKKWLFADPEYATTLQLYGESMNLFFSTGYDVHLEPAPPEVPIKEVILHPGDVVYFPAMTLHAVVNMDEETLGIDQPCMDFGGSLRRHWLVTVSSMLNPFMILKVFKQFFMTGRIDGHEVYFDDEYFSSNTKA